VTVHTAPATSLSARRSTPPQVTPGGSVSWTVTVTNGGPSTARDTAVEDTLPAGVTLVSTSGAGDCSGDPVVLCLLGDPPAGTTATVLNQATVDPTTQAILTNSAAATTPDESDPADNVAQMDTEVVAAADVSVIKTDARDPSPTAPPSPHRRMILTRPTT
jgi:uncharacterized repeat protein (TIGR01451 family)